MVNELDISEVSKLSGLPASTLRYYEEKGLITPIGRKGLKRVYHAKNILMRLSLISLGREAKFSLDEISVMLNQKMVRISIGVILSQRRMRYRKRLKV